MAPTQTQVLPKIREHTYGSPTNVPFSPSHNLFLPDCHMVGGMDGFSDLVKEMILSCYRHRLCSTKFSRDDAFMQSTEYKSVSEKPQKRAGDDGNSMKEGNNYVLKPDIGKYV